MINVLWDHTRIVLALKKKYDTYAEDLVAISEDGELYDLLQLNFTTWQSVLENVHFNTLEKVNILGQKI